MTIIFKYTNFSETDRETVLLTSICVIPRIEVASQVAQLVKNLSAQCRRHKRCGLDPWVRTIPWRRKWQPSSVLAKKIPWTKEPGGLQSMGSQRVRHD